jgi:uncharacterized membrane protein
MYAPVSRAAVHKRLHEGKMTAFAFHVVESKRSLFGYQKKLKQRPYLYVPVSECKAWAEELKARPDRKAAYAEATGGDKPDWDGEFLDKATKGEASEKVPPQEFMPMIRQAVREILDEEMPTFTRVKARRAAAAKAKGKLGKGNKNAK